MPEEKKEKSETYSWRAAEYEYREKSFVWYLVVVGIALLIALPALFNGNFFFGIFVLLAGAMVIIFARRKPRVFDFEVSEGGVKVGKSLSLEYKDLKGFCVRKRPGSLDEIIVRRRTTMNPYLRLPADADSAKKVEKILSEKLPEIEYEDSLVDVLADRFGF